MNKSSLSIIVIGGLNTDIIAFGVDRLLKPGEHTYGKQLYIGAGGKSRNIAQMIAELSTKKNVAMVGKTSKDQYGLWKFPIESLQKSGVNTDYVSIVPFEKSNQFPGIALIPVDTKGNNQIYVLPGINNDFSSHDIDSCEKLFLVASKNHGMLVVTLELPYKTALYAIKKANKFGLKVMFDQGGIEEDKDYSELFKQKIFLLKPNEHEAQILTGIIVKDGNSAKKAAEKLLNLGVENVFITIGAKGGYVFNKNVKQHIPIPKIKKSNTKDETGCGDQTMAAFVVATSERKDIVATATLAIRAGTLQFYKSGIKPLSRKELGL